ncbi:MULTISPECIES: glycosyltransferase [unclassified Gordonia (in: high G+C Gram-positive bacteria)]|uniref:glycosyltransferase n=1 Tax=unclassified Gordonia (in: high G+C Gram-positive bacteria) TaxID=2657482 RepID=UPI0010F680E5|nr:MULTISPECIES: glycosyltransferase [unclassified Gordonia (in: high G+C Gram-positive bacteria)]
MRVSDLLRPLVATGTAMSLASLALTLDNARRVRRPGLADIPAPEPLSVLIPMRDEAHNAERCLLAVLEAADRWPGPARIHVLDDGSADGTDAVLARLASMDDRVRVHPGSAPPPGWLGKTWACAQLAEKAFPGGVHVFLDADVVVEPHAFTSSFALLRNAGLDLVSPYPRQVAVGAGERLVQPLLQWSWLSTLPLGLAERSPRESLTAANGQFLVVDAAMYRRAGGHEAVHDVVLEDIALLRAVKAAGGRGVVAEGSDVATCRMYRGWDEVRAGYRKSLWSAFGSPGGTLGVTGLLCLMYVLPAAAALFGSRTGLVGYLAGVASRVVSARCTGGRGWPDAFAHPLSVLVFTGLAVDSTLARQRGDLQWKGRPIEVRR